jgi:hypothetical protein
MRKIWQTVSAGWRADNAIGQTIIDGEPAEL